MIGSSMLVNKSKVFEDGGSKTNLTSLPITGHSEPFRSETKKGIISVGVVS